MNAQTWISLALAIVAVAALCFTGLSAITAVRQARLHENTTRSAAQPYIWADLRPDDAQGGLLLFVLGNSGRTVATNVRVVTTPPLDDASTHPRTRRVVDQLSQGLSSLPPGRTMVWSLGPLRAHLSQDEPARCYVVQIDAEGPYGPVPTLKYTLDLEDLRVTKAPRDGSMHLIAEAIKQAGDAVAASVRDQNQHDDDVAG